MSRILKKPRVKEDLIEHYASIARDKIDSAERFLKVAEETFQRISEMPFVGRAWESDLPHLADVRVYPMPAGFRNYLIFYRPIEDGIEVLTVLRGARDLDDALKRLRLD
jgi:toxin ParE1/3/4